MKKIAVEEHFLTEEFVQYLRSRKEYPKLEIIEHAEHGKIEFMSFSPSVKNISNPDIMRKCLDEGFGGGTIQYLGHMKDRESVERIGKVILARGDVSESTLRVLVELAGKEHTATMLKVLALCNEYRSFRIALPWFGRNPSPKVVSVLEEMIGNEYEKKFHIAIELASRGNENVVKWAVAEMNRSTGGEIPYKPIQVIAFSPLPAANEATRKIIEAGDEELASCLLGDFYYLINRNPHLYEHIQTIRALPWKGEKMKKRLQSFFGPRSGEEWQKCTVKPPSSSNPQAHIRMGEWYLVHGKFAEASSSLKKALELADVHSMEHRRAQLGLDYLKSKKD